MPSYLHRYFTVEIVSDATPNATVISGAGIVDIPILEACWSTPPTTTEYSAIPPEAGWIEQRVYSPSKIGGLSTYSAANGDYYLGVCANLLRIYAPEASVVNLTGYVGKYLRLRSSNGVYACAEITSATASSYGFYWYLPNGTSQGQLPTIMQNGSQASFQRSLALRSVSVIVDSLVNGADSITDAWILTTQAEARDSYADGHARYSISTYETAIKPNLIAFIKASSGNVPAPPDGYSYPDSEPGGGETEPENPEDVTLPTPPTIGAVSSGFVTLYLPTLSDINSFASYLWSISFDIEQVKKMFASPMDAILGLYILPLSPAISGSKAVSVAGVPIGGYTWNYTTQEYITLSCGSVEIPRVTGSYLDYSPMTKLQIWLPFIGFRDIDADDCMGKTLTLQYNISVISGACVANLLCGNTLLYSWAGNCAMQIPITGADYRNIIGNSLSVAATIAGLAVGSPTTATTIAGVASVGQDAINAKPTISRSGSVSGDAGFLAKQLPYIVRSNPVMCKPENQNTFIGYPSFTTVSLASLNGYNEIFSIHIEGVPGTDAELSEIENLLHSGVIF